MRVRVSIERNAFAVNLNRSISRFIWVKYESERGSEERFARAKTRSRIDSRFPLFEKKKTTRSRCAKRDCVHAFSFSLSRGALFVHPASFPFLFTLSLARGFIYLTFFNRLLSL
jgi:hypothetical protein